MTDHATELREAGEQYQQAREQAEALLTPPRDKLTEKAKAAYADGMKKADILRAINHVWSDRWLDNILKGVEPPASTIRRQPAKRGRKTPTR